MPSSPRPAASPSYGPGRRLVSLREDVEVEYTDPYRADCPLLARTPWGPVDLGPQDGPGRTALWRMALGPVDPANLTDDPLRTGLDALFVRLADVIVHSLAPADGTAPILSVVPVGPGAHFSPVPPDERDLVGLVGAVVPGAEGRGTAVTRPAGLFRVELHRPSVVPLVADLGHRSHTVGDVGRALGDADRGLARDILAHLIGAGVATASPAPDKFGDQPRSAAGR